MVGGAAICRGGPAVERQFCVWRPETILRFGGIYNAVIAGFMGARREVDALQGVATGTLWLNTIADRIVCDIFRQVEIRAATC